MSIFLSCGEASGDHYLALLIKSLKTQGYKGSLWGMLGPQSERAGAGAEWSYHELHLMGFLEVLPSIPRLLKLKNSIVREILLKSPELVVVVDSPDFHLPLIRSLRKAGYSGFVVYIAPPTVWAWRESRTKTLSECCDLCLPILSFENEFLLTRGVKSRWVGHPLLDSLQEPGPPDEGYSSDDVHETVVLLPGSRPDEIKRHLPVLLECASGIADLSMKPVFSISPGLPGYVKEDMKKQIKEWDIYEGPATDIMSIAAAVVGVSGTVSTESLLLGKYMVVIYRGSLLSWVIYKLFIKTSFISIPNIMAGHAVFPEFLQKDVNVDNVMKCLRRYFSDERYNRNVQDTIKDLRKQLGENGASQFWARCIMEFARS